MGSPNPKTPKIPFNGIKQPLPFTPNYVRSPQARPDTLVAAMAVPDAGRRAEESSMLGRGLTQRCTVGWWGFSNQWPFQEQLEVPYKRAM